MIRYGAFGGCQEAAPARRRTRQRAIFAVLAALLSGCAPGTGGDPGLTQVAAVEPVAMRAPVPSFTASSFITTDAQALPARQWLPAGEPRAVILALHGFNDYSNAFDKPARYWASRGIATYAYDQRGFGGAPGRMHWPGSAALAIDAVGAAGALRVLYPGKPVFLLGESMGGAVAILAATGATGIHRAPVDGVILSAPAVWTQASMQILPRLALWAGVRMFPDMVFTGESLHILASDNIPMLLALGRDPMVIKGARVDALYGLVDLMDSTVDAAARLDEPMLLMYGAHDAVIPGDSLREFVDHLPSEPAARQRLAFYRNGYHMLLRDLEGPLVAADVAAWMFDRRVRLPSRSDAETANRPWPPPAGAGG